MKKIKTLLMVSILLLNPFLLDAQIVSTSDTVCIEINKYNFFVESTERYFNCVKNIESYEKALQDLENILIEKQEQLQISEMYINSLTNELDKQRKQNKWLSVGLGGSLIAILLLAL